MKAIPQRLFSAVPIGIIGWKTNFTPSSSVVQKICWQVCYLHQEAGQKTYTQKKTNIKHFSLTEVLTVANADPSGDARLQPRARERTPIVRICIIKLFIQYDTWKVSRRVAWKYVDVDDG